MICRMTESRWRVPSIDWTMVAILGIALAVRICAILLFPSLHHPDENFQLFEAAHRRAFGYGIGTWEDRAGLRSPVIPYLLSRVFALAEPVVGGPKGYIVTSQILLAALSLIGIAAVYRMGLRESRTHAVLLGLVAATWFEMVYFSFRPLTEAVAFNFLLVSLALASVPTKELSWRRLAAIGFCVGLTLMLRVQLLPALLFLALWVGRLEFQKRWVPLLLGSSGALLIFGLADWIAWGSPFHSYIATVRINLFEGKASQFGTEPFFYYFEVIAALWWIATLTIVGLVALRIRNSALWIGVALCIIAAHALIPHKEYRFIFPATACLVIVAVMASADFIEAAKARVQPRLTRSLAAAGVAFWVVLSVVLASSQGFAYQWYRARDLINAQYWLAAQPDLCGVAMLDRGIDYGNSAFDSGGNAFLHRNVPMLLYGHTPDEAKRKSHAFNYIVLARASIGDFSPEYRLVKCNNNVCVVKRPGGCVGTRVEPPSHATVQASRSGNEDFFLTDANWVHGVARRWAGFFVPNTGQSAERYKPGRSVKFADGEVRKIVRVEPSGQYLNIYVEGEPLDPAKAGVPSGYSISP